jgi:hypothetical protein
VNLSRITLLAAASTCALVISPAGHAAGATTDPPVAHTYEMNEAVGATAMHDDGAPTLDGVIGSEVQVGVVFAGATGYRFPRLAPNTPPAHPAHLVSIPDDPTLDPGEGTYSIQIRYRTTNKFGNLIQKGQSATKGGQIKIQLPKGRPSCYYKGSLGRVGAGAPAPLSDGAWHTLRCTRTPSAVDFYVDGVRVGHKNGASGLIDNALPMTIGGKPNCDQITVTCDYFGGDVDYVHITKG